MESLKSLQLSGSAIKVLPPSIEHLNGLQLLRLCNCKNLEMLPSSICNLTSLEYLYLSNCSKLDKLPDNLENLKSLKCLGVRGSAVGQLPSSITCLENLKFLDCSGCRGLTILPPLSGLHSLRRLHSKNCSLMEIPEDIGCLSSLEELELSGNMFKSLPKSIKQLSKLEFLSLRDCNMLRSIPELPDGLKYLEAMGFGLLHIWSLLPDASEFVHRINFRHSNLSAGCCVTFNFTHSLIPEANGDIFKESLRIMLRTEKESGKPSNQFTICLPGGEIPEWFSYQSLKFSVNIQVLRNDLVNRKFTGFAICVVFGFDEYISRDDECYVFKVRCDFKTYHDHMEICNGGYYLGGYYSDDPSVSMDSEYLLLGYCSYSSFYSSFPNPVKLPANDSDYVDISIEFESKSRYESYYRKQLIKRCAAHPMYAEETIEIIGASIQDIEETSGRRSDRSNDNEEEMEPHP